MVRKFDNLLFGNGMTMNIMKQVKELISPELHKYCDINSYFKYFVELETHKCEFRHFVKLFNAKAEYLQKHIEATDYMKKYEKEIYSLGFERFISKYVFSDEFSEITLHKDWIYTLYNYWYDQFSKNVLNIKSVQDLIKDVSMNIEHLVNGSIYTLNFDLLMDNYLKIEHLHGRFVTPINSFIDTVIYTYNNEKNFERKYLLGTNGYEKLSRLHSINKHAQNQYNLDFFFNSTIDLGNLLIYGISFEHSDVIPEEVKNLRNGNDELYLVNSVDGHVLLRLFALKQNDKLKKITMTYYTDEDLKKYKEFFYQADLLSITQFVHSTEIM